MFPLKDTSTRVIMTKIIYKARANTFGMMVESMLASGTKTKCTDSEPSSGQMVGFTKDSTSTTRNMDWEHTHSQTDGSTMGNGTKANSTEKELPLTKMELRNVEFGTLVSF